MKIERLKEEIREIGDPRRVCYGNLRHTLEEILIIALCTVVCGGEDFVDMEDFGREREDWLRGFLKLPNGIPDSDTFRRVLERINPNELSKHLTKWLATEREKRAVVSIDGKTIRGSGNEKHRAYHVIRAFVAENQIVLGDLATEEKSNEITAVPELLEVLDVEGAIITADAMSCQTDIAEKITEKKADYVLGLKGNQTSLHDDVELYFENIPVNTRTVTKEKGHGRIETREYFLETDIDWLSQKPKWTNLNAIGMVKSTVIENGETRSDTRFFITSLADISEFAYAVRKHWSIENQLHWCLDVIFREDAAKMKKDSSPLNMNVLRKTALPLLSAANLGRIGIRKKMFKAALNPVVLEQIIFPSE